MGRDDIRTNERVTLRDGWGESLNDVYDFAIDDVICGFVVSMPDGCGWLGAVLANGRGDDPPGCRMDTIEEAMIWVETTYALTRG
jgi:hypothetical protein